MMALRPQGGVPVYANAVSSTDNTVGVVLPASSGVGSLVRGANGFQPFSALPTVDGNAVQAIDMLPLPSFIAPLETVTPLLAEVRAAATLSGSQQALANKSLADNAGIPVPDVSLEAFPGAGLQPYQQWQQSTQRDVMIRELLSTLSLSFQSQGNGVAMSAMSSRPSNPPRFLRGATSSRSVPCCRAPGTRIQDHRLRRPPGVARGVNKQISAVTFDLLDAPFEVTPDPFTFDSSSSQASFSADIPSPPATYRLRWEWGDGTMSENLNLPDATHNYQSAGDYEVIATLLGQPANASDPDPVLAIDTVHTSSGEPFWRLETLADLDGFIELGDPGTSGEEFDAINRAIMAPHSALIAVDDEGTSQVLRLRVLPASTWPAGQCCPTPTRAPGELRVPLGVSPAQVSGVGPFFTGWQSNAWTQSSTSLGQGTLMGQTTLGTASYDIINVGTQIGPAGATRIQGTRTGTTMTGTITFVIWWRVLVNGVPMLPDVPGEQYQMPFTAVRLK